MTLTVGRQGSLLKRFDLGKSLCIGWHLFLTDND